MRPLAEILLVAGITFLLIMIMNGCNFDLDHRITVGIDDNCLTHIPDCTDSISGGGQKDYYCRDGNGVVSSECRVGCLGGRALMCTADGPECVNDFAGSVETVPVICTEN